MIGRREVVTGGLLGSLAAGAGTATAADTEVQEAQALREGFKNLEDKLGELKAAVDQGLRGNSMSYGNVGQVRAVIEKYAKATGKFPDYCDIGLGVFYDVYDWHVRHQQQIQIARGFPRRGEVIGFGQPGHRILGRETRDVISGTHRLFDR